MCTEQSPWDSGCNDNPLHLRSYHNITKSQDIRAKLEPSSSLVAYNPSVVWEALCADTLGHCSACNRMKRCTRWASLSFHLLAGNHISPSHLFCSIFCRTSTPCALWCPPSWPTFFKNCNHSLFLLLKIPQRNTIFRPLIGSNSSHLQHHCLNTSLHSFLPSTGHFFECFFLSLKSCWP